MRPGCFAYCGECVDQAREMAAAGHPNPCHRQFWDGPRLVKPGANADGCDEFHAPLDERDIEFLAVFNGEPEPDTAESTPFNTRG